jgi:hypothetical protein
MTTQANENKKPALSSYEYIHAFSLHNKGQQSVEKSVEPGCETVALLGKLEVDLKEDQWGVFP